jgi:glucose/arabinose dehydrogenase
MRHWIVLVSLAFIGGQVFAAPRHEEMDYGPFLSGTFVTADKQVVLKGIAIRLDATAAGLKQPEGPIGGGAFSIKPNRDVGGADNQEVYKSQRHRFGGYQFNVPNGKYKVTLKFADCWQIEPGARVFGVSVQSKVVLDKLDIIARVGTFKAFDHSIENVEVTSGQLTIGFNRLKGDPSIAAIVIEGKDFTRKINCGGEAVGDYVADWEANYVLPRDPGAAGVLFDTELCRYAAFWTGGYLNLQGVVFDGAHGTNPSISGGQLLHTKSLPGVANKDGQFNDPRAIPHGPLPREHAKYMGLYRHQDGVVLHYSAAGRELWELPALRFADKLPIFDRHIRLAEGQAVTLLAIAHVEGGKVVKAEPGVLVVRGPNHSATVIRVSAANAKLALADDGRITVAMPPRLPSLCISLWSGAEHDATKALAAADRTGAPRDLTSLLKGGRPLWPQTVETKGRRAADDPKSAYVLDTLTLPDENPYKSWMRVGGFDFLPDGRAALSTWSGDVWLCSGIDDRLEKLTWKRYAAGLFHALGMTVRDGKIYVLGRDQITRLHDVNNDGEADYYECFNNDVTITQNFHEFAYELQTDPTGNFYFIKGGPVRPGGSGWEKIVPNHGSLMKVSPDGSKLEVVARGFRAPNGIGVGPRGELTTSDNEGTWTPAVPLNWIKPGGFYGVVDFAAGPRPTVRDNPLCWFPKDIDNSGGGQVWITGDRFGPLSGQLLHMSYGTCTLFSVLKEDAGGQMQGGVVPLPLAFESGICRGRFRNEENALYLTGLRGWQSRAGRDGGLYRIRYTGRPYYLPTGLAATPEGIKLAFDLPLDKSAAEDIDNYNIETWNYRWTEAYGSPQWKARDPKQQGHDEVDLDDATLSSDGKTVLLKIADLAPVMQMKIAFTLKAADGTPIKSTIHNTINVVGNQRAEVHVGELKIVPK